MARRSCVGLMAVLSVLVAASAAAAATFGGEHRTKFDAHGGDPKYQSLLHSVGLCETRMGDNKLLPCACTLVAEDVVLTTAHCVFFDGKCPALPEFHFGLGFNDGHHLGLYRGIAIVGLGVCHDWNPGDNPVHSVTYIKDDWIEVRLDRPVSGGTPLAPMGVTAAELAKFRGQVVLAQYPGELDSNYLWLDEGCSLREQDAATGVYLHDCSVTKGSSGGPVLIWSPATERWLLLGLYQGNWNGGQSYPEWSRANSNVAVSASRIFAGAGRSK